MRRGKLQMAGPGMRHDEDTADFVDVVNGLERDLALEQGTLLRELTAVLSRRRQFEELRREHDVRLR